MTNLQRTYIAAAVLVCSTALAVAGVVADHANASGYIGTAVALYGTILGYVFGRANGEKALAGAIVTAAANGTAQEAVNTAVRTVLPAGTVDPTAAPPSGEGD